MHGGPTEPEASTKLDRRRALSADLSEPLKDREPRVKGSSGASARSAAEDRGKEAMHIPGKKWLAMTAS